MDSKENLSGEKAWDSKNADEDKSTDKQKKPEKGKQNPSGAPDNEPEEQVSG